MSSTPHSSPLRRWGRRLLFGPLVVLLCLLLLEGAAHLAIFAGLHWYLPPTVSDWISTHQVRFDPELGWVPATGFPTIEGDNFLATTQQAIARPREATELRGFALGDSQTHGAGLVEHFAWPSITEKRLRDQGMNVRVINLASSGYRSAQALRLVESYILPMGPDFLLVDCMVNDGKALPRNHAWPESRKFLFESRLYRLLWLGVASARGQNLGTPQSLRIDQEPGGLDGEGSHAALMEIAQNIGIPIYFLDYPFMGNPIQSYAPAERLPRGANVIPVTAALRASGYSPGELFQEANHLSVLGSEIVGVAVAERLQKELAAP